MTGLGCCSASSRMSVSTRRRPAPGWLVAFARPRVQVWVNGVNFARWLLLAPLGMALWAESVPFLVFVSLDTAVLAALGNWLTALAAVAADPEDPLLGRGDTS